jgi:hypothetical protein
MRTKGTREWSGVLSPAFVFRGARLFGARFYVPLFVNVQPRIRAYDVVLTCCLRESWREGMSARNLYSRQAHPIPPFASRQLSTRVLTVSSASSYAPLGMAMRSIALAI